MLVEELLLYKQQGNGVLIRWNDFFLFVLGKEEYWEKKRTHWEITYTNTGGHVEKNEDILDATRREVLEEIGCEVDLISSNQTLVCELENPIFSQYQLEDRTCPILIYNSREMKMSVCVYLGVISSNPIPKMEVPALILVPSSQIQGGKLSLLLREGAVMTTQGGRNIPKNAVLKPFGSADIVVKHWDVFLSIKSFSNFLEK